MLLATLALATDWTASCPVIASPEELFPEADLVEEAGHGAVEAARTLWEEAEDWVDASCLVSCGDDCFEADCVTPAGATVTYRESFSSGTSDETYPTYSERSGWSVSVVPPADAGVTWTSVTVEGTLRYSSNDSGESDTEEWIVSWTGDWTFGTDGAIDARRWNSLNTTWGAHIVTVQEEWTAPDCEWRTSHSEDSGYATWMARTSGAETWVDRQGLCSLDGVVGYLGIQDDYEGEIDKTTWAWTGRIDADGDCWLAGEDCDDTDATIRPEDEIWYDGIDQDCDGNDADQDGDTHDAEVMGGDDCDDTDAGRNPDVIEVHCDGVDADCSGDDDTVDIDADGLPCEACDDLGDCPKEDTAGDTSTPDTATPDTASDTAEEPSQEQEPKDAGCGSSGGGSGCASHRGASQGAAAILALVAALMTRRRAFSAVQAARARNR